MSGRVASVTPIVHHLEARGARRHSVARAAVFLMVPVATLLVIGLGAIMSATSVLALRETGDHLFYFKRQVAFAAVGVLLMLVAARVPYRIYKKLALPILLAAVIGLVAVLVIGEVRGGARRWIAVGPLTMQPSEFAKFAVVVYLAAALSRKETVLHRFSHFFWPVAVSVGLVGALVMAQPDLGTTILIAAGAFAVLMASQTPLGYVALSGLAAAGGAVALAAISPYRWARVTAFLDPAADPLGSGFQATQSLVAIGTGGWFGIGLGASRARWSFLPNAHTDFIFAIIGEETGFAGAVVVLFLFVVFAVAGSMIALRAPDPFGRMLGIGIVAWLSVQALVNVGGVTSLLPITGVPLPFVSFGGTALLVNLAAVGVLLNIAHAPGAGAVTLFAFAAAGTGGHVYPALAVAAELEERGTDRSDIVFFGGSRLARVAVPAAGYEFIEVPLQGLQRRVTWHNLRIPHVVWLAAGRIRRELVARRTRAMLATGGYVTIPAGWAAQRAGTPLFLQEQNAEPGLGNRVAARWAQAVFTGFATAAERLGGEFVGNPLRTDFTAFDRGGLRPEARRRYDLPPDALVLGVFGGSLGASVLDGAVVGLTRLLPPAGVAILHAAGSEQYAQMQRESAAAAVPWRVVPFEEEMHYFYAASDLVLCRAGGTTLSELAATGTPAAVVPRAATDQRHNAAAYAGSGAAVAITTEDPAAIGREVAALMGDPARRASLAAAAATLARPEAAAHIATALQEAAHD